MKKAERILCNYMASFFEEHFDKIEYDLADSNLPTDKAKFIKKIKNDAQLAMWGLSEMCTWGMDKVYLRDLYFHHNYEENENFSVLKINDDYIKVQYALQTDKYTISATSPKTKTVVYFD